MNKPSDLVANLQSIGNRRADLLDNTAVVTSNDGALGGQEVNVLPVCWIKGDSDSLDFDIIVTQFGNRGIGDQLGLSGGLDLNGALRHCG